MKKQKDRITLMACSNATGTHKLPLMFVGKAANPRCFKNINKSALPVKCFNPRRMHGWIVAFFSKWFHEEFVPSVRNHLTEMKLPAKALLLLDNAAHPEADTLVSDGNFCPMKNVQPWLPLQPHSG